MSNSLAQTLTPTDPSIEDWRPARPKPTGGSRHVKSFLEDLRIDYGPMGLLGRFFLRADQAVRERGITLAFADLPTVRAVNKQVQDPWWDLMPMFDCEAHSFSPNRSLALLGYNADGDVVASQAARVYDLRESNLHGAVADLSLFYGSAERPAGATCQVTAAAGEQISGFVTYSGCGWYRPDYRGRLLSTILPRISRALALAMWNAQYTISFIDWKLVRKGVSERYGYRNADDGVHIDGMFDGDFYGALAWMPRERLLEDLQTYLGESLAQIDRMVGGRGDEVRVAKGAGER
ncbi:MAG: hypothetical protein AAF458_08425 [Pseudomonadota bacterium]